MVVNQPPRLAFSCKQAAKRTAHWSKASVSFASASSKEKSIKIMLLSSFPLPLVGFCALFLGQSDWNLAECHHFWKCLKDLRCDFAQVVVRNIDPTFLQVLRELLEGQGM